MRVFILNSVLCFAIICCARGQETPALKLDRRDLTVLGVTLGSTNQTEVESKLGKAQDFNVGHGDEMEEVVCYRSASHDDDTIVAFYFGALGGWTDVTRISVSTLRALPWPGSRCKSSGLVSRKLEFLRGLRLGSPATDVVRALGPPSRSTKTKLYYSGSYKCGPELLHKKKEGAKPNSDSPCDVVDSVEAKVSSDEGLTYLSFYHFVD